jgi:predicted transcriptional regulator
MKIMAGRPQGPNPHFAPLESEVMAAIWAARGALSVRQVLDAMNRQRAEPLAYTTVMTVMNRLAVKGALARSGTARRYLYQATGTDAAAIAVRDVIRIHGDAAVAHLVEEARANSEVMRRLRALLEEPG